MGTLALGAALIARRRVAPAHESTGPAGLPRVLHEKWYIDRVYDALIVRPFTAVARWLGKWIDDGLLDAAVNGAGHAARALGWVGSRLQTGQINTYAFAIVLGVLFLIAIVMR